MSGFHDFVRLYDALDRTTSTTAKREALAAYFAAASDADLSWAIFILTGRRLRRPVSTTALRAWASAHTGLPPWLVEASWHTVGDLGETLALLCSTGAAVDASPGPSLAAFMEDEVGALRGLDAAAQQARVTAWWTRYDEGACLVAHKLLGGALRVGVSATLASRALADATGQSPAAVAHRLMGTWEPTAAFGRALRTGDDTQAARSRPYPFALATPLDPPVEGLGDRRDWQVEWKWDGIRAQVMSRGGEVFLWSRGEELLTDRFPEVAAAARALPDGTVLDGELVIMRAGRVQPFRVLQTRIGRTHLTPRLLQASPAVFLAFDLLEADGRDLRDVPLVERRARLEGCVGPTGTIRRAGVLPDESWAALAQRRDESRAHGVEGLVLKRLASPYRGGRPRGDWWKWKVDPYTMDAVLVYAQAGHGKRAALYTDYTFAVWDGNALVPVAKAYSGLDQREIASLDAWIRAHTTERFGPVRAVEPVHVFELGFEAIAGSPRHKAGIAVRFPRILRWRTDKPAREANTLADLRALIASAEAEDPARRGAAPAEAHPSLFDALDAPTGDA